jgi:hypothetical protein
MTSKIRIALTALAAAFAVAVSAAPLVPAAHAEDSIVPSPASEFCAHKWNQFAGWVRLAAEADRSGNTADRDYYLDQARKAKDDAQGCDWVRRAAVDPLGGRPVGDGLLTQQSTDSPTTGSDPTTDPGQVETPETANSSVNESKSKGKSRGKSKGRGKWKKRSRRTHR